MQSEYIIYLYIQTTNIKTKQIFNFKVEKKACYALFTSCHTSGQLEQRYFGSLYILRLFRR